MKIRNGRAAVSGIESRVTPLTDNKSREGSASRKPASQKTPTYGRFRRKSVGFLLFLSSSFYFLAENELIDNAAQKADAFHEASAFLFLIIKRKGIVLWILRSLLEKNRD